MNAKVTIEYWDGAILTLQLWKLWNLWKCRIKLNLSNTWSQTMLLCIFNKSIFHKGFSCTWKSMHLMILEEKYKFQSMLNLSQISLPIALVINCVIGCILVTDFHEVRWVGGVVQSCFKAFRQKNYNEFTSLLFLPADYWRAKLPISTEAEATATKRILWSGLIIWREKRKREKSRRQIGELCKRRLQL
jgi:hypothetical protein